MKQADKNISEDIKDLNKMISKLSNVCVYIYIYIYIYSLHMYRIHILTFFSCNREHLDILKINKAIKQVSKFFK